MNFLYFLYIFFRKNYLFILYEKNIRIIFFILRFYYKNINYEYPKQSKSFKII